MSLRRSIGLRGDVLRRARSATDLDPAAERQDLVGFLGVDAGDGRAAMSGPGHESVLLQPEERLANGALAAPHFPSEPEFGQRDLRVHLVHHDAPLDGVIDDVAGPFDGCGVHRLPRMSYYQ